MLAGTIIVADHCFWTMDRDATNQKDDFKVNWKNMNDGLQSTIQIYLSQRQEAVMEAIVEGFPEPDILSLSVMSRLKLDQGKERDKKESDLTEELLKLVLKYRLPMPLQRVSQVASGSK
ncbi:hypothetical protein FRB95_014273 [Tulasnella sp. JGI-2019a]|nr:hypothetical protein FRB93_001932 [Tulasnella sp. JGI-2019a]KAG9033785.1 hypothetical protein FRB95_014273 [Tulasnella sp. JGI-2019a]